MCMWEGVSVWEHARRWGVGNPAGSGGGRLGVCYPRFCDPAFVIQLLYPCPDFIYTYFFRGRALDFYVHKLLEDANLHVGRLS